MPEQAAAGKPLPIVPYLKLPEKGEPYLEGFKCTSCGAVTLRSRTACASCGGRKTLSPQRLSNEGKLHVFSITHRSFPGIPVPFVSAIADLDGGGSVKTNLIGVDPDPEKIKMGMRVRVVYEIAPRKDREGNEYMTFYLRPAN
jgi:uncharacterized OB-fold protein